MTDIKEVLRLAYQFGKDNGENRSEKNFNDFLETSGAKEVLSLSKGVEVLKQANNILMKSLELTHETIKDEYPTHASSVETIKKNTKEGLEEKKQVGLTFDGKKIEYSEDVLDWVLEKTENSYMRGSFSDKSWKQIAKYLLNVPNTTKEGVACLMLSKHIRWSNDFTAKTTFKSFKKYFEVDRNGAMRDLMEWSKEPYDL